MMKFITLCFVAIAATASAGPTIGLRLPYPFGEGRIVGGKPAVVDQFPYQVTLQWGRREYDTTHFCGGFIVNNHWVITAAHCPKAAPDFGVLLIKAGKLKLNEQEPNEQVRRVKKSIIHQRYAGGIAPFDIALLLLDKPLTFNEHVQPINLPNAGAEHTGTVVLSGWGSVTPKILPKFEIPNNLQYADLEIIDYTTCKQSIDDIIGSQRNPLHPTNVCTGPLTGGLSPCAGDSGGPLAQKNSKGEMEVVGIVSWGFIPCGTSGAPSVYTKVSAHNEWIALTMSSYK